MAFPHCSKCDWAQDDFYDWTYNPLTRLFNCIKWWGRPRTLSADGDSANRLSWLSEDQVLGGSQYGQVTTHSWFTLCKGIISIWKQLHHCKWLTVREYEKSDRCCPDCNGICYTD